MSMLVHVGMDLSRHRLDVCVLGEHGERRAEFAVAPTGPELRRLTAHKALRGQRVRAVIESMNGARYVHDTLELVVQQAMEGWALSFGPIVRWGIEGASGPRRGSGVYKGLCERRVHHEGGWAR